MTTTDHQIWGARESGANFVKTMMAEADDIIFTWLTQKCSVNKIWKTRNSWELDHSRLIW